MTAPRPFRLRVLDAMTALFAAATPADGYANDLRVDPTTAPDGRVFRGRVLFGDSDPLPMLSLLEDPKIIQMLDPPEGFTAAVGDWPLIVQGFVDDDHLHPTDPAHILMADAKRALAREIAARGGSTRNLLGFGGKSPCVTAIRVGAGVVRPPDEFSSKAYFWLPVTLSLAEDIANP